MTAFNIDDFGADDMSRIRDKIASHRSRLGMRTEDLAAWRLEMPPARVEMLADAYDRLAAECERQRRVIEEMRPVYDEALLWRRELIGERTSYDLRLEAAIDTALAAPKEEP